MIETQKTVNGIDTDCHGIRLDVSIREVTAEDGRTVQLFDVEPNNVKSVHLPKRSRYYQALTDVKLLEAGVDYENLPDMWTIWILPYDPFGKNYMLYSVKNRVEECPGMEYNDGIKKLFLYTGGKRGGSASLQNLLIYMENSIEANAVDEELEKLHLNVKRLKHSKEIGVKYMQMQEVIKYKVQEEVDAIIETAVAEAVEAAVAEAVEAAVAEAVEVAVAEAVEENTHEVTESVEQRMAKLTRILLDAERYEDLRRITQDKEYRKRMLAEYCI